MLFQRFLSYTLRKNLAQERSRIFLTTNVTISVFDKHEYIKCSVHDSLWGLTFIRYIQCQKIGKPYNMKVLRKPKGLSKIAMIC